MKFRPYGGKFLPFSMLVSKKWKGLPIKLSKEELEKAERTSLVTLCEVRAPDWKVNAATIQVYS